MAVEDTTPPEKINDLRILNAAADGNNVFTIGWTAPGDDLNVGQGKWYAVSNKLRSQECTIQNLTFYVWGSF